MSINVSFSHSFRAALANNADVSNADVSFTRNENDSKANVKSYSNAVAAFFGRIISFIWHNSDNKLLKASYINDITQRIGKQAPGRADFLKTVEGLVNKTSGAPLSARTVRQIEVKFQELKSVGAGAGHSLSRQEKEVSSKLAKQAFNLSRQTVSSIKEELLQKADNEPEVVRSKKGHPLQLAPKVPDTSVLIPRHMTELMEFARGQEENAPRASLQSLYWGSVVNDLKANIK